ncbi:3'-5' exoribonuclease YhaM family protein [Candidatus Omnitrophota bacterium]
MNKTFVSDIRTNSSISTYFLVSKKEKKLKKNGEPYLRLVLSDKSGNIDANMWDAIDNALTVLKQNVIVKIEADVTEYRGQPQLTIRSLSSLSENDYDITLLIKALPNIQNVFDDLQAHLEKVNNPFLKTLIKIFLNDSVFVDKFLKCPGGMLWHHAYIGGLLQHTYEVMQLGLEMCKLNPEVDQDLVIVGAFLHDIGKIEELDYSLAFNYTDEGRLLGHICIGYEIIESHARGIENFPQNLLLELKHILLSHQGEYEQRSPVLPQTIEACIVYHCDNLSSQTNAFKSVVYGPRLEGETWSKWFPIISRQLLLREEKDSIV